MKQEGVPFHLILGGVILLLLLLSVAAMGLFPEEERTKLDMATPESVPCMAEEREPNDRIEAADNNPALCPDVAVPGTLRRGDQEDLYRIVVPEEGVVEIELREIMPERDFDLYLYDAAHDLIAS